MLRHVLSGLGVIIALGLVAISCALSYQFSQQLGGTPLEAQAYGVAAVGIDLIKALMPFFIVAHVREGRYLAAIAAGLLLALGIAWSFTSALGLAAQNRMARVSTIEGTHAEFRALQTELTRLESTLNTHAPVRTSREITAEIDRLLATGLTLGRKTETLDAWTNACSKPTRSTLELCNSVAMFRQELAVAETAEAREARAAELRHGLARLRQAGAGESTTADVQAHFIGRALALATGATANIGLIQLALVAFVALVLEAGSSCGLYVALGTHRLRGEPANASQNVPEPGDVLRYCTDRLMPHPGHSVSIPDAYLDYAAWCAKGAVPPLVPEAFEHDLQRIAATHGLAVEDTRMHHVGLGDPAPNPKAAASRNAD